MNWTGGRLSRHSHNVNGSEIQRQKQHFAKVRSSLLNGPHNRSPIKWSLFNKAGDGAQQRSSEPPATPCSTSHKCRDQPDYSPEVHERPRKRHRLETKLKHTLAKATLQSDEFDLAWRPSNRPCIGGESDDGLLHGTQSSSHLDKDKRLPPSADMNVGSKVDFLERRRRILRRTDWVGANIQYPMKLRFRIPEKDERVGKRRKITGRQENQFGAIAQSKWRLKQKTQKSLGAQNADPDINTEWLPKNQVRISIGGRQMVARASSSTNQSRGPRKLALSPQASTSDMMLLDREDIIARHRQPLHERNSPRPRSTSFPEHVPIHMPHRMKISPSYGCSNEAVGLSASATPSNLEERISKAWTGANHSTLNASPHSEELIADSHGSKDDLITLPSNSNPNLATLRALSKDKFSDIPDQKYVKVNHVLTRVTDPSTSSPSTGYITDVSRQLSKSARKLLLVARGKSRRIAYISSQPELFHPRPLTQRTSRVLHNDASDSTDSTAVQIDMAGPGATSSQMLDEEIWKTWILSSEDYHLCDKPGNEEYVDVSISPGISNYGQHLAQEDLKQPGEEVSGDIANSDDASRDNYICSQSVKQSRVESRTGIERNYGNRESLRSDRESINHMYIPPKEQAMDYRNLFLSLPKKIQSPPPSNPVRGGNPDEAWMKFILSDDDDDNDRDALKPYSQRSTIPEVQIQTSPKTSLIAYPSTKTASSIQPQTTSRSPTRSMITAGNVTMDKTPTSLKGSHVSNRNPYNPNRSSRPRPHSLLSAARPPSRPSQTAPTFSTTTPSQQPNRRLTFIRPPRFDPRSESGGNGSGGPVAGDAAVTVRSPIRIGRGFLEKRASIRERLAGRAGHKGGGMGYGRGKFKSGERERYPGRDIYNLDDEDDVESIEDD